MRTIVAHLLRHAVATASPALVSVAHLILQLSLAHRLDATGFGVLAILLTIIQFGFSLSNALVVTPYTIAAHRSAGLAAARFLFVRIDALLVLASGLVMAGLVLSLGGSVSEAAWWGAAGLFSMLRWFCRSHAYAVLKPFRAAISDLVYVVVLLAGLGIGFKTGWLDLTVAAAAMALGAFAGSAAVGEKLLIDHVTCCGTSGGLASLSSYGAIWRDQSRWTLLGVATTEATNNAHTYLVALIAGPASLAPIALAGLFVKPVTLAITSLTQLERPTVARAVHSGNEQDVSRAMLLLRVSLIGAWSVTTLAIVAILAFAPALVVGPGFDMGVVLTAVVLWGLISLAQCLQTPGSVLLQAMAEFRILSAITIWTGLLSIALAAVLTATAGAVFALVGTLAGATATLAACEWLARSRMRAGLGTGSGTA